MQVYYDLRNPWIAGAAALAALAFVTWAMTADAASPGHAVKAQLSRQYPDSLPDIGYPLIRRIVRFDQFGGANRLVCSRPGRDFRFAAAVRELSSRRSSGGSVPIGGRFGESSHREPDRVLSLAVEGRDTSPEALALLDACKRYRD